MDKRGACPELGWVRDGGALGKGRALAVGATGIAAHETDMLGRRDLAQLGSRYSAELSQQRIDTIQLHVQCVGATRYALCLLCHLRMAIGGVQHGRKTC